jgi:hypothetical protein
MAFEELQRSFIDTVAGRALSFGAEKITGREIEKKIESQEGALWLCCNRIRNQKIEYYQIKPLFIVFQINFACPEERVEKLIVALSQFESKVKNYPGLEKDLRKRVEDHVTLMLYSLKIIQKDLLYMTKPELIKITLDADLSQLIGGIAIGATVAGLILSSN